jgi:hypothetical protein
VYTPYAEHMLQALADSKQEFAAMEMQSQVPTTHFDHRLRILSAFE